MAKVEVESRIERGAKSQSPDRGCGPYVNVIDGKSSIIAQTSERREGRVKSSEVLDLIHILYRDLGLLSIFLVSRSCKVVIIGFGTSESQAKETLLKPSIVGPFKHAGRLAFFGSFPR